MQWKIIASRAKQQWHTKESHNKGTNVAHSDNFPVSISFRSLFFCLFFLLWNSFPSHIQKLPIRDCAAAFQFRPCAYYGRRGFGSVSCFTRLALWLCRVNCVTGAAFGCFKTKMASYGLSFCEKCRKLPFGSRIFHRLSLAPRFWCTYQHIWAAKAHPNGFCTKNLFPSIFSTCELLARARTRTRSFVDSILFHSIDSIEGRKLEFTFVGIFISVAKLFESLIGIWLRCRAWMIWKMQKNDPHSPLSLSMHVPPWARASHIFQYFSFFWHFIHISLMHRIRHLCYSFSIRVFVFTKY